MVQAFSLKPKVQEEYFNFRFDGYIFLTKQGSYQFRTGSDDGSRLRIDDKLLVDNNGVHTFQVVTSTPTALSAGAHRITVDFFEYNESDSLLVEFNGPENNNQWTQIPPSVLKSSDQVITALDPTMRPGEQLMISVYPNPTTSENINVKMEAIMDQKSLLVELIDPMGRRIAVHQAEPGELIDGIQLLPAEKLSTGFYIIKVSQGNSTVRQRLIISK
jgi:hypothetical protein